VVEAKAEPPTVVVNDDNSSEEAEPSPTRKRGSNLDGELMTERPSSTVRSLYSKCRSDADTLAEQQGEKDAQDEDNTPQTPAAEGGDGGWGAADGEATVTPAAPVEEEEEEVTKSYDEYLAERAASQISGLGKKEGRQVNNETVEGTQFRREAINDFFHGKVCSSSISIREYP
jgi:hypothetical protein